jgi:hypothetical protein
VFLAGVVLVGAGIYLVNRAPQGRPAR